MSLSSTRPRVDTAPPVTASIVRPPRADYTFADEKLIDITRRNTHLLTKLTGVANRKGGIVPVPPARLAAGESSGSINRRRKAAEIERENMRLLAKLQATKPAVKFAPPARSALARAPSPRREASLHVGEHDVVAGAGDAEVAAVAVAATTTGRMSRSSDSTKGTMKVGGKRVGVPPTRGDERDMRDLALSACRDNYL